jgi:Pyruvate/2-oxoacid:ferredoxin oxidoreductase delta subunit
MALYIPYLVGASVASYLTKNVYNYMSSEEYVSEETNNNNNTENTFLKISEDPIILESETFNTYDTKLETIIEEQAIESHIVEDKAKEDKAIEDKTIEDKAIEDKTIEDKAIENHIVEDKAIENHIVEDKAIEDKTIELKGKIYCYKCKLYLPHKCFSKNQFKKYKRLPSCKICTKLK